MRPILFSIGSLRIFAYGTMLAVAFLAAIILASREGVKRGITKPETIIDLAMWLVIGGVIGARLLFVLLEAGFYWQHPWQIFNLRAGGMSFYGGALGGFGAAWWYGRRKQLAPWPIADLVVPYVALAYAIVRVGCLLNGCCYGVVTHVPWALPCAAGEPYTLRHPTQLYAIIGSLLLFALLMLLRRNKMFPGFLFFLYMGLYGLMRGIIEFFRDDPRILGPIRLTQLACLAFIIFAAEEIWRRQRHYGRNGKVGANNGEEVGRGV